MSVHFDYKISFYFVLTSCNVANHLSLFILTLGPYPVDQQ